MRRVRLHPIVSTILLLPALAVVAGAQIAQPSPTYTGSDRVEDWTGRTILVFSPHPDDDMFTCAGTVARLVDNGNDVHVVVYSSGNAGSRDPEMTLERLAEIRRGEEERALAILGVPRENLVWMGYDDGMMEYVDRREMTRAAAAEIRRVRPDAVFAPDPGAPYEQYHKSDHRAAAFNTADAIRAARWRLYFPELEAQGLEAWDVKLQFLYYSANPNYEVDVTSVIDRAVAALASNVSQFGRQVDKYDGEMTAAELDELKERLKLRTRTEDGRHVERFRREE
ncbi:MAG: PIG-L deacetylase family protein [Thermoanaerobaculia bacterium]|nr:PIG-L deacetylase family protein [Thermoanaerobaculia bacterium]